MNKTLYIAMLIVTMFFSVVITAVISTGIMFDVLTKNTTKDIRVVFEDYVSEVDTVKHIHNDRPYNDKISRIEKRLDQLECGHLEFYYDVQRYLVYDNSNAGYSHVNVFKKVCYRCGKEFWASEDEYWQWLRERVENKSLFLWRKEK